MACFLVSTAEAIVATVAAKVIEKKEKEPKEVQIRTDGGQIETVEKIPFSRKLKWLRNMLWGGSALLAFEHLWSGEVVPWFPFLTATQKGETMEMLMEMATRGVSMAALITAVWVGMVVVSAVVQKRALKAARAEN